MSELNQNEKEYLINNVISKFELNDLAVGLEKLYWHVINDFYDKSTVMEFLIKNLNVDKNVSAEVTEILFQTKTDVQTKESPVTEEVKKVEVVVEKEIKEIPKVRTMEKDMDKVHGYGAYREINPDERLVGNNEFIHKSTQDDALSKPKLAEMPKYSEGE